MTMFCAIDALVIESLRSILGKNLVVFLRRLGAAADIHRILRLEAKVGAKLYHQFIAALDGDNGTAGFDANIRIAWVIFFQAANGHFDHAKLGIDRDGFFTEQPPGKQLPRDLTNRKRKVGARGVDSFDVFSAIDPGDDGNVGRQVFENDRSEESRRIGIQRQDYRLDVFDARLFQYLRVEHVTDQVHTGTRLSVDEKSFLPGIGEQFGDLAADFAAAGDEKSSLAAQLARAGAQIHETLQACGVADENQNAAGLEPHVGRWRRDELAADPLADHCHAGMLAEIGFSESFSAEHAVARDARFADLKLGAQ